MARLCYMRQGKSSDPRSANLQRAGRLQRPAPNLILIKEIAPPTKDSGNMTQHPLRAIAHLVAPLLALAACQTPGSENPPPMVGKSTSPSPDTRAPAFVQAACGGCHAVEPPFLSANPQAPSFAAIANRSGLSEKSLANWLAEAHNYPEDMDFTLTRPQIDQIARYMVTLRKAGYVPDE
jgi:mono/diheme cytochrome c family protein